MIRILLDSTALVLSLFGPRGLRALAFLLGVFAFDILRLRRNLILSNLQTAFGESKSHAEKVRIGRESTVNFLLMTLEFFASERLFPTLQVTIRNRESVLNALKKGRGILFMGIHMGNFELKCYTGTKELVRLNSVTKPVGRGGFADWVHKRREGNGEFEIKRDGPGRGQEEIIAALARNEGIGFMVDQRRSKGVRLPFFGKPALTNTGLFYLYKRFPTSIIPAICFRTGVATHELVFFDEFEVESHPDWSEEQFIVENSKRMNKMVETMIALHPEQYFWMHNRWK